MAVQSNLTVAKVCQGSLKGLLNTVQNIPLPLGTPRRSCSFSQEAKVAFSASAIFLLVPGVSGGTCDGMSVTIQKSIRFLYYVIYIVFFRFISSYYLRQTMFENSMNRLKPVSG